LNEFLDFIKANISWIKDIFTVIIAITATVISILTYHRAKATILQPIRNEVVKKQSILLSDLLEFLSGDIDKKIDYLNIVSSTAYLTLKMYGFIFKDEKEHVNKIMDFVAGHLYCGDSDIIRDVELVNKFTKKNDDGEDIGKIRYEELKKGVINIEWIAVTKDYYSFYTKLKDYSNNPFLPSTIQIILNNMIKNIDNNLLIILKEVIADFLKEFSTEYFSKGNILPISNFGLYNDFNHKKVNHKMNIDILKKSIRTHLKIDDKWE
jgi:hypothetical protein